MKYIIKLTSYYLNTLSYILPKYCGKKTFSIFRTVHIKKIKTIEKGYYKKARHFRVKLPTEDLKCYEFGNKDNKIVFLVHGWGSNAGCLTLFANELVKLNYRVIGFDLPGHATNKENKADLIQSKNAFLKLITQINPTEPFSIISHSFGSAITAFSLSKISHKIDNIIFLSSNNHSSDVFKYFKKILGFNNRVFKLFIKHVEFYFNESVDSMIISSKVSKGTFNKLLIIHDKFDKVIPFNDAIAIYKEVDNSILIPFEKIGHYRMLWNKEVVSKAVKFLEN